MEGANWRGSMISTRFLLEFKRRTEERWDERGLDPDVYGFQFQVGSRWNPGLSFAEIAAYENEVGIRFPTDFKTFLGKMNGTDLPTLNVYGSSGEPSREWIGVYQYPKDIDVVREMIATANRDLKALVSTLAEEGMALSATAKLMPIFAHRCVVCDEDPESSVVLSIWDAEDAIVYGRSLQEYLEREFLGIKPQRAC
jgi:hypothetical protein